MMEDSRSEGLNHVGVEKFPTQPRQIVLSEYTETVTEQLSGIVMDLGESEMSKLGNYSFIYCIWRAWNSHFCP